MLELKLQRHLVDAAKAEGGYGKKISHRMIVGVLDLFIQLPGLPGSWIEVKLEHKKIATIARPDLTPHQRKEIMEIRAAGGHAGWLMAVETGPGRIVMECGIDPKVVGISMGNAMIRERGAPWPIREIVRRIIEPCP